MENIIWSTGHQLKIGNIVDSDNCYLYDTNGNRFIDLESGVWCTSVGHNNKRINKVITAQINKITHTGFCYCHPQIDETAKRILEITGIDKGKCEFLCSGSEAVEYGMRVARKISEKPLALTFSDSYFGAYGDAAAKNENRWHIYNWLDCSCKNESGCTGDCEDFQKIPFEDIGIFLFEPGSSSGLVRFPPNRLIKKIVLRIKENNGVVMANEITTGIGRTGKWFGYQHYDFVPDVVAIGKGIGNGYPVSITVISDEIAGKLENTGFLYSQSHQNDPLGAVVANEVIAMVSEEKLLKKSSEQGEWLMNSIRQLDPQKKIIKEVRGRGLMIVVEFHRNAHAVYEELLKRAIIVAKRSNAEALRIDPALTIKKETLELFIDAMREIIEMNS
ncbi:MAG TPA: aspartate aminotransferase family protein [Draconibacterium sp.]|nr:aspartate aminotransferase family protein [Draconibacterium sp.]